MSTTQELSRFFAAYLPQLVAVLALVAGIVWWKIVKNKSVPKAVIHGWWRESSDWAETRTLPIQDGTVRWETPGDEDLDVTIPLDPTFRIPAELPTYHANLDAGKVFRPVFMDDAEPEEFEEIDGKKLTMARDDQNVRKWRHQKNDRLTQFLKYAPWVLGFLCIVALAILFVVYRMFTSAQSSTAPNGGNTIRPAASMLSLLWLSRPWGG